MSKLLISLENNKLKRHFQQGEQRLLCLPANTFNNFSFCAYLSTLGGGLVNKDKYYQEYELKNSDAFISSQSNQKIYKGSHSLNTKIFLDENSSLVFYNHANIFYENSDFYSKCTIFSKASSRLFYLDAGFVGYAKKAFKAKLILSIFNGAKLVINDVFCFNKYNFCEFYDYEYFYNIISTKELKTRQIKELKIAKTKIENYYIYRVLANDNDIASALIDELINDFKG